MEPCKISVSIQVLLYDGNRIIITQVNCTIVTFVRKPVSLNLTGFKAWQSGGELEIFDLT